MNTLAGHGNCSRSDVMKVVAMNGFGSADTFRLEEREKPNPKEREIRIRIKSAGFNPVDWKIRQNWYGGDPKQVLGCDCSGIVDAVGDDEKRFSVGDEVCAMTFRSSNGSYAQYACVPEELAVVKPSNLSFNEAATIPLAAMTAYRATLAVSAVKKRGSVYIAGAGGGVGAFVVQLLMIAGAGRIYTVAKNEESVRFLVTNLNIDRDSILIYEAVPREELKKRLLEMNGGRFFDSTFDLVGGEMKRLCLELTGYSGHFSTIVPEAEFNFPFWEENSIPRGRNLSVHQVAIGAELGDAERGSMQVYERHLKIITGLLATRRLKPPVVTVVGRLNAETVRNAHVLLESGHVKGKLVMVVEE